ncbi:MAG: signal peptide peptidase SppA [Fibromonadaceae bacterium]|jgi:protease-4|nr:signal peptide peptidase SppA [Fibromonadaceae bacterium]
MKQFLKYFFASMLGTFSAAYLMLFFFFAFLFAMLISSGISAKRTSVDSPILRIDLSGIITERENYDPLPIKIFGLGVRKQGLSDILEAIKKAKDDRKVKGIYLNVGVVQTGIASMQEIRDALIDFKESGKFVIAYGEVISQRSYYGASVADKIILNPIGMLELKGLGTMQQYNKGVFEKMGIEMQVFKVGTYKSYIETFTENKMSDYDRKQKSAYLTTLWKEMLNGISESRGISTDSLNRYADEYLLFSAPESLIKYGLIDSLAYRIDFENLLKEMVGIKKDKDLKFLKTSDILSTKSLTETMRSSRLNKIAVLYAEGSITGDVEESLYSDPVITAKTYVRTLKKIQEDSTIKAVVFRVNSSGGSAYASDQIWHSVRELSKVKPVVASFGSYAASGGYYIACGANKIVSSPVTLTGSIGIFGLFPSGEKLANRMGASYDGIGTNENSLFAQQILSIPFLGAGILPARPLSENEHAMLQVYVERGYDTFLTRCAEGRSVSKDALDAIGQGRVWTGAQAVDIGLVDTLGGIETALKVAAELANLENYAIEEFPKQKDPFEKFFEEIFAHAKSNSLKFILGKDGYETRRLLNAVSNYDFRQAIFLD